MSDTPQLSILKVFSGPHTGAEIVLIEDQYLVGRSDDCDLVLGDDSLGAQHVRLAVTDGRVTVVAVDGNLIYIDGEPLTEGELAPFQFLTLGKTNVAYGPADEAWPELELPTLRDVVTSEPDSDDENPDDASDGTEPVAESSQPTSDEATSIESTGTPRQVSNRTRLIVAATLLLLLGSGGIFVAISAANALAAPVQNSTTSTNELQRIVSDIAPTSTVTIVKENEQFVASGFVTARSTSEELEQALTDAEPTVDTSDIHDTETIASAVRGFLKMRKLSELNVELGELPGQVVVSGILKTLDEWRKAKSDIQTKTQVHDLVDQVLTPERVALIAESKPAESVLPPSESVPAPPATQSVTQPTTPKPRKVAPSKTESGVRLPFQITDVTVGRTRFFTIEPGIKVTEHSKIKDHFVKSIASDRISLVKDGRELIVRLDL